MRSVPRICEFNPGFCLTTEEKHGKTSVRVVKKCCFPLPKHPHLNNTHHIHTHTGNSSSFDGVSVECVSDALCRDAVQFPTSGSILNMETTCSSGTWLPTYRIIRSHTPESHNIKITFRTRHCTAHVT